MGLDVAPFGRENNTKDTANTKLCEENQTWNFVLFVPWYWSFVFDAVNLRMM